MKNRTSLCVRNFRNVRSLHRLLHDNLEIFKVFIEKITFRQEASSVSVLPCALSHSPIRVRSLLFQLHTYARMHTRPYTHTHTDHFEVTIFSFFTFLQIRESFHKEYTILAALPFHRNIVRMFAFFYDRLRENLPQMAQFDAVRDYARNVSLLLVLEYHPSTLAEVSRRLRQSGQLTVSLSLLQLNPFVFFQTPKKKTAVKVLRRKEYSEPIAVTQH